MNTENLVQHSGTTVASGPEPTTAQGGIREAAQQAGQQIKQKAAQGTEQLKAKGSEALDQVRQQAREVATERRDYFLERLQHCSTASRKAAEQLRQDNDPTMASYAEALASQIDRSSSYLRERDLRGIWADTEDFARRRPEIFFGGLFIAGLALARFLKASSRHEQERSAYGMRYDQSEEQESDMVEFYSETKAGSPEISSPYAPPQSVPVHTGGSSGAGSPLTGSVLPSSTVPHSASGGATSADPTRPGSSTTGGCGCA